MKTLPRIWNGLCIVSAAWIAYCGSSVLFEHGYWGYGLVLIVFAINAMVEAGICFWAGCWFMTKTVKFEDGDD